MSAHGLFARYAYPPNELGYCGPADASEVLRSSAASLEATVRCFEGTWPYFEFIANRHDLDPLDERVIESYWLGGSLTEAIDVKEEGQTLLDALAHAGGSWAHSPESLLPGMAPDHNFHVFAVYPWLGLLTRNISDQPRVVLDRCRIRWGTVLSVEDDSATVLSQQLVWDGAALSLGTPREERAVVAKSDVRLVDATAVGENVALHWDWICHNLSSAQLANLIASTSTQLDIANARVAQGLA